MRTLNKSLHTREAFGVVGQAASFLGAIGALFLVYTGFAMSWRRFFGRGTSRSPGVSGEALSSSPPLEVDAADSQIAARK